MKTYSSSPDIMNSFDSTEEESASTASPADDRLSYVQHSQSAYFQQGTDYSRPFRPNFRPKTPPPPPPPPPSLHQTANRFVYRNPMLQIVVRGNVLRLPSYDGSPTQRAVGGAATTHIIIPPAHDNPASTSSPPPLPKSLPPSGNFLTLSQKCSNHQ